MANIEGDAYPQGIVELGFLDHVGGVVCVLLCCGRISSCCRREEGRAGGLSISKAPNKADKEASEFARAANAKLSCQKKKIASKRRD